MTVIADPDASERTRWRRLRIDRTSLADKLLVVSPRQPIGWRAGLVATLAVVVGTGVSLVRQSGPGALDTVWDEDGRIFLADAANRSLPNAFSTAYEGYYHATPRLLTEIAVLFPAGRAAAAMAIMGAVTTSALGLFVYTASRAPTFRNGRYAY